ncbi:MAG: hypothetical protein ACR2JJ_00565 [Sphingomicrobium sp.]
MRSLFCFLLCLAACDQASERTSASAPAFSYEAQFPGASKEPQNRYSRQLFEMNGQVRLATFRKLMVESDKQCDLVTEALLMGSYEGMDFWRIACTDSGQWRVSIEPDSSTRLMSCAAVEELGNNCEAFES